MKFHFTILVLIITPLLAIYSQTITINQVPTTLPQNTPLSTCSPMIRFNYSDLNQEVYTLKVWLLERTHWYCASTQWCERTFTIDNSGGNNASGSILVVANMDVYDYGTLDWVVRLYNQSGSQVSWTEQYASGTTNRNPVLNSIGNKSGTVGQNLNLTISASDPNGGKIVFSSLNLPSGATLDSTSGQFNWIPDTAGTYSNLIFIATDDGEGPLSDAEKIDIVINPSPTPTPSQPTISCGWVLTGETPTPTPTPKPTITPSPSPTQTPAPTPTVTPTPTPIPGTDLAYDFLRLVMDQYHSQFYVYKDMNAGGNYYPPSGWMGDWGDISFDDHWTTNPAEGTSCIRISYSVKASQGNKWAGIYWQSLDSNWGDKGPGIDLTGATKLRFQARGEKGGEKAIFKVGGINWQPYHNNGFPNQDSCETISIGPITLSRDWKTYEIDIVTTDTFKIYTEQLAATNNFIPSASYNGSDTMTFDYACAESPHTGETCVKITWNGQSGVDGWKWNGLGWEWPEGRVWHHSDEEMQGYNLNGARFLKFWIRSEEPGLKLKFKLGHKLDSTCGEIPSYDLWTSIETTWTLKLIYIPPETDMSNITIGFAVFFNDTHDPGAPGLSFYLDDIEFDKSLKKDLSSLIGGFCWVTDGEFMNPNGCTIYLDNIYFDKPRLNEPRFLQSYMTLTEPDEYILNNYATTYDNALALIAFTLRGDADSRRRAGLIADAFVTAMEKDRDLADHRVRNAYRSGDIVDSITDKTLLPGWWDNNVKKWLEDKDFVGTKVGDAAWAGMALLRYYKIKADPVYLNHAINLGDWIINNTWDSRCAGGFTGGYWGWPNGENHGWYLWKSTEHNLDCWCFFESLYQLTNDKKWYDAAEHAKAFVLSRWHESDGFFDTGVKDDGCTTNTDYYPLDTNSWGIQATYPESGKYRPAARWAEANCATTCDNLWGFDFNSDKDGVWFEGTAQMAVSYACLGEFDKMNKCLWELRKAQVGAKNADGKGMVAACKDGLSTGMEWKYNARLHVGATCWYIFAEMGYNPFRDISISK